METIMSRFDWPDWTLIPSDPPTWKDELVAQLRRVYFVLMRSRQLHPSKAFDIVVVTILGFLQQWKASGPPDTVTNLYLYVLQAAVNTYARSQTPRKDAKLLQFVAPEELALDPRIASPGRQPLDTLIFWETVNKAMKHLCVIPENQIHVMTLFC